MTDDPEAEGKPRAGYAAPALEKGLDILELLAGAEQAMTTGQIADRLGRSKNEIFRMVFVLENRGYLVRDPATDMLGLSNRLFQMGLRTPRSRQLIEVAFPSMEELSDRIGHSAHLVVVNRGETVVIASATGGADVGFTLRLGYRRPAMDATSGQTIIAFQPADVQQRLLAESRALVRSAPDDKRMSARLRRIRADGYLIAPSHDIEGVTDICAPILNGAERAIAAIVVPCLKRIKRAERHEDVATVLVAACQAISRALRHTL